MPNNDLVTLRSPGGKTIVEVRQGSEDHMLCLMAGYRVFEPDPPDYVPPFPDSVTSIGGGAEDDVEAEIVEEEEGDAS